MGASGRGILRPPALPAAAAAPGAPGGTRSLCVATPSARSPPPPRAGAPRGARAVLLFVILASTSPGAGPLAFLSAGAFLVVGVLLVTGRPRLLSRAPLARVALDALLLGGLVGGTGGGGSTYFPLYFLAALGVFWVSGAARVAVGSILMAGGYLVAGGFADGG